MFHLCRACRSATVKFSSETVRGSCHGKCREISGAILLLLFPQEAKLQSAQNCSRHISRNFSRDVLQLQMPNFMAFSTLQTFVPDMFLAKIPDSKTAGSHGEKGIKSAKKFTVSPPSDGSYLGGALCAIETFWISQLIPRKCSVK